jgi:hypothetical protein
MMQFSRKPVLILGPLAILSALQAVSGQEAPPTAPFADADMQPAFRARCADLRRLTEGVETGAKRIDLAVEGELTIVHSDGVLTYLGLCRSPEPQVLCVTYSDNGMKLGDRVTLAGGYSRPDADHILLDPCLASPPDGASD